MGLRAAILQCLALWLPMQFAAAETAQSGAKITAPLNIENEAPLYFGKFSPGNDSDGRLTLHETGVDSDGIVTLFSNDQSAARFRVSGRDGALYAIELPDEVTLSSPSQSQLIAELVPLGPRYLVGGEDVFFVCAHLTVPAQQDIADYSGIFTVTVSYQ